MTQHPPLEDPRDKGQRLYSSLLILGLDATALEHSLRTPVNQKMFVHMNKKLGETLLHFLFVCIDQEKAVKVFRDCWPLLDKKQEAQFHRATFEWYKTLKQSYGQPVPAVVAKTFMAPGGPKFISTLMTLTRIALHSSLTKKAPDCILHFPAHSRNSELNHETLLLLKASKYAHHQNFIVKQKVHLDVLKSFQDKAKEFSEMYRRYCSEKKNALQEFQDALSNNENLTQNQKNTFSTDLSLIQKEILCDIRKMNGEISSLRCQIEEFRQNEELSWKIISPLLDGTTSLSHIDGSMYSPQVPQMVYKAHANTIKKMGLHGLYCDDKLDLLSLIQYSNLALHCLCDSVHSTRFHTKPESVEELNAQAGCVTSLSETVTKLSSDLNKLLPSLMESVATHNRTITATVPSLKAVDIEGKPHLCPPTPPLSLVNTSVAIKDRIRFVPLHLTPSVQHPKVGLPQYGFNITPSRILSGIGIAGATQNSPIPNVVYSPATQKDESIQITAEEKSLVSEAGLTMDMLTVDCRGRYLKRREREKESLQASCNPLLKNQGGKSLIPRRHQRHKESLLKSTAVITMANTKKQEETEVEKLNRINVSEKTNNVIKGSRKTVKEGLDNSLLDRLADAIANEDDSGAAELLAGSLCDEVIQDGSTVDSGCVEMTADSDTLLDAIETIDITPRCEQLTMNEDSRSQRNTPGSAKESDIFLHIASTRVNSLSRETPETCQIPKQEPPSQFAKLIDGAPCEHLVYAGDTPKEFSEQTDLVSKSGGSVTKQIEKMNDSSQDLLAKMSFFTQTPVKNKTPPLTPKIHSKFDRLDLSIETTISSPTKLFSSEDTSHGCIVEELRHHSKTKLNVLLQQIKQQHSSKPGSSIISMRNEGGFNSNFISYVQNLKKNKESTTTSTGTDYESVVDLSKPGKTIYNKNSRVAEVKEGPYNTKSLKGHIHDKMNISNDTVKSFLDVKGEFSSSILRMQDLLGDDCDDTLTENVEAKKIEKTLESEESFINAADIEKILRTPGRRSSYLPESSLFDTLTDSILTGETDISILDNETAKKEVQRESISSCRQSLVNLERMSLGSSKRLSEVFTAFENRLSVECSGILDESDSCLLSASMDDF